MESHPVSRRAVVGALVATSIAGVGTTLAASVAPKETGLSSEGLLAGRPGFQPRSIAPLAYKELPGFLSARQLETNYGEYKTAVEQLQQTEQALLTVARLPTNVAEYGALRRRQVALANSVLLHEFYFGNLTATPPEMPAYVSRHMKEHMGSVESWADDFRMCALSAQAWAALVYDPYDDRWHNTVMDHDSDGLWVGANPLVVCDVAAHAYNADFSQRDEYVSKFLQHIDWTEVGARYHRVDRM
jgi:superoxide dismutase, Fe-Mn family